MRKLLLIILALFGVASFADAQIKLPVDLVYKSIDRSTPNEAISSIIYFEDSELNVNYGSLPVYRFETDLPSEYFGCEIDIEVIKYDTLQVNVAKKLMDRDLAGYDFLYDIKYKNQKAVIDILPIKKGRLEDEIILLSEFELIVDFVPVEYSTDRKSVSINYADESILASGTWVKMGIVETGIHKITYNDLANMGLSPSEISVNEIGVFGNYNGLLPEANNKFRKDDLQENSIYAVGFEDGKFDQNDYILFYAQSPVTWKYNPFTGRFIHQNNIYSDTTFYFFTPNKGSFKRISTIISSGSPTHIVNTFIDYKVHERDYENMTSSGKEWYGERFEGDTMQRSFNFKFDNIVSSEPANIEISIIGRSMTDSYYNVSVNDSQIVDSSRIRYTSSTLGIFARKSLSNKSFALSGDDVVVDIDYLSNDPNAVGWLDYIVLNVERNLIFTNGQMKFCNPHISSAGNISKYIIENTAAEDIVWDITDIHNPAVIQSSYLSGNTEFTVPADSIRNFIVFDNNSFKSISSSRIIPNQNLHGITSVNYVIIRPPIFESYAEELADVHRENDQLATFCISPEQIYNEFSSGSQDISAIRDFMRMLYKKGAFNDERAYLLLFGDASFDYKNRIHDNSNLVPTFESAESLRETGSFATDDYFGLLDDYEGAGAAGNLDIGIGRFPITTTEEAEIAVGKVKNYIANKADVMGDWRTDLCFVADDRDNNLHLTQAEGLVDIADTLFSGIGINKIYLDAYKKVSVPGGFRYPEVNKKLDEQITKGALLINYTGHGGLIGWSDELVLDVPMINAFSNTNNMPLVITATCEFSRFDNPEFTSAGEYMFLNPNGGAIALLTTTRLAYAHANYVVNRRIYYNLIKTAQGDVPRLGDLIRLSKIPSNENYLNFTLLGDPALTLAYPEYTVVNVDNGTNNTSIYDTVNALTIVNVEGQVVDNEGAIVEDFNGYLYPKVVDKASRYQTLANDGNSYPKDFILFDKVLFKGKTLIKDGKFNFEFRVPKDINYNYGFGKIRYYAVDTVKFIDAWGAFNELLIGGINENAEPDDIGPDIELFLNSTEFKNNDVVTSNPVMLSYISDESGINNTGSGIGRDIVAVLDNDYANPVLLNSTFVMDVNTYKSGKVVFPFQNLTEGFHSLTLKAWDLNNNSSEKTIDFYVDDKAAISLSNVFNYPNPMANQTEFTVNHNKAGTRIDINITIFDLNGSKIVTLKKNNVLDKQTVLVWDGKNINNQSVPAGVYIYTVEVTDDYNNASVIQQKLIKLNK